MSAHDYGVLVEAVSWIEQHSGNDAPVYPRIQRLSAVVDNISKRRQPDSFPEPRQPIAAPRTIDLRNASPANAGSNTNQGQS
jgi:hypothetical protein